MVAAPASSLEVSVHNAPTQSGNSVHTRFWTFWMKINILRPANFLPDCYRVNFGWRLVFEADVLILKRKESYFLIPLSFQGPEGGEWNAMFF